MPTVDTSGSSSQSALFSCLSCSWADEGFLGVRLKDLLRGGMLWCLVSNYMLDFRWLLSACPELHGVPRIVLVHGEKPGGER